MRSISGSAAHRATNAATRIRNLSFLVGMANLLASGPPPPGPIVGGVGRGLNVSAGSQKRGIISRILYHTKHTKLKVKVIRMILG